MLQNRSKALLIGAVVWAGYFALTIPSADAFWRHHGSSGSWGSSGGSSGSWGSSGGSSGSWGSSGGSSGSWGSSGGSSGSWGSSGGSSGSWGSSGGLFHHRRWRHRCYTHSSGGSSGSWGSSGGSSGSYGSSGGSSGSWGSSGGSTSGVIIESHDVQRPVDESAAPAAPADPNEPADPDTTDGNMTYRPSSDGIMLTVRVPAGAKVLVNGLETSSVGEVRRYISRGIEGGYTYNYEVQVIVTRDGKEVVETKSARVRAGQSVAMDFDFSNPVELNAQKEDAKPATKLTLIVPTDAKVFLAGRETKSKGRVREFTTTKLSNNGQWTNYPIRVEFTQNGETMVKEETVSLQAGDSRELRFDFEPDKIAQANIDR